MKLRLLLLFTTSTFLYGQEPAIPEDLQGIIPFNPYADQEEWYMQGPRALCDTICTPLDPRSSKKRKLPSKRGTEDTAAVLTQLTLPNSTTSSSFSFDNLPSQGLPDFNPEFLQLWQSTKEHLQIAQQNSQPPARKKRKTTKKTDSKLKKEGSPSKKSCYPAGKLFQCLEGCENYWLSEGAIYKHLKDHHQDTKYPDGPPLQFVCCNRLTSERTRWKTLWARHYLLGRCKADLKEAPVVLAALEEEVGHTIEIREKKDL